MIENVKPKGRRKTPISYYGGKQSMLKHILPLIPEHTIYVEAFFGGGAVFWAKDQVQTEVINDYNGMVANFYEQLKTNYPELKQMIDATPYSRQVYQKALVIYEAPYLFTPVVKAWAFWVATAQGYCNRIGTWRAASTSSKESQLNNNKKLQLTSDFSERLKLVQIDCKDALYMIKRFDSPDTFFYLDPPYVDSEQGHYGGYTQEHFNHLLSALANIKGKFLLSSYPNDVLENYRKKFGWKTSDQNMQLSFSRNKGARKTECLTYNY